jgi:hypothetical protein
MDAASYILSTVVLGMLQHCDGSINWDRLKSGQALAASNKVDNSLHCSS